MTLDSSPDIAPPTKLARFGDYELLEEIARGGMGVVFKARQVSLNRIVAVKMILHGRFNDPEVVQRFHAEAEAAANLNHPNIVAIYDIGVEDGQHYFSMEFIAGRNLSSLVRDQPMAARRAATCVKTIAEAIYHAHRHGILHRDLKPSNVMIDMEGGLRVMDFGLAKRIHEDPSGDPASGSRGSSSELTVSGQVLGSPAYMSPEQAAGRSRDVTVRSDVYSLGAVLYHLVTGRAPFMAENMEATLMQVLRMEPPLPRLLNPSVPRDIETICMKCLEKDPARRYASASEVADELDRFLRGEPVLARPVGRLAKVGRWCKRRPLVAGLGGAIVVLVLSIAIGSPIAALRIDRARRDSVKNANESQERLRRLKVARGIEAMEAGDSLGALPWLIDALRLERPGSDAERLARLRLGVVFAHAPRVVQFWSLGEPVRSVEFSPDSARVVMTAEGERPFVASETNGWRMIPFGEPGEKIPRVAFSPDGSRLAFGSRSNVLYLARAADLALTVPPRSFGHSIKDLRFTPNGTQLFVSSSDGLVQMCDGTNGSAIGEPWATGEKLQRLVFNDAGTRFLVVGEKRVSLYDFATRERLIPPLLHRDLITAAKFSGDGEVVLTSSRDGTAQVCRLLKEPDSDVWRAEIKTLLHETGKWVTAADISRDGRRVATSTDYRTAHLWDTTTGTQATPPMTHAHSIFRIQLSPDGERAVTASFDGTARIWDARTGEAASSSLRHNGYVSEAIFSPDGKRLLTAGQDGVLRLWEFGSRLLQWQAEGAPVQVSALSPDDSVVAIGDRNGGVTVRGLVGGELRGTASQRAEVSALVFSPTGEMFATGTRDGVVQLHSASNGAALLPEWDLERPIHALAFSPRGDRLIAGGEGRVAHIWETTTGEAVGAPLQHTRSVRTARFSPDGKRVATGSSDRNAQIWDVATGNPVGAALVHDSSVVSVLFSPDGTRLATAVSDTSFAARAAHLWDIATGREIVPPMPHSDGVTCLSFSADGKRLASGSEDGTVYIWDAATGQRLTPAMRHDYHVYGVQFLLGDRALFTNGRDGVGRLWDAATGEPLTVRLRQPRLYSAGGVTANGRQIFWGGEDGRALLYSFHEETRPVEELAAWAELLTGRRLDADAGLMPTTLDSLTRAWERYGVKARRP